MEYTFSFTFNKHRNHNRGSARGRIREQINMRIRVQGTNVRGVFGMEFDWAGPTEKLPYILLLPPPPQLRNNAHKVWIVRPQMTTLLRFKTIAKSWTICELDVKGYIQRCTTNIVGTLSSTTQTCEFNSMDANGVEWNGQEVWISKGSIYGICKWNVELVALWEGNSMLGLCKFTDQSLGWFMDWSTRSAMYRKWDFSTRKEEYYVFT